MSELVKEIELGNKIIYTRGNTLREIFDDIKCVKLKHGRWKQLDKIIDITTLLAEVLKDCTEVSPDNARSTNGWITKKGKCYLNNEPMSHYNAMQIAWTRLGYPQYDDDTMTVIWHCALNESDTMSITTQQKGSCVVIRVSQNLTREIYESMPGILDCFLLSKIKVGLGYKENEIFWGEPAEYIGKTLWRDFNVRSRVQKKW